MSRVLSSRDCFVVVSVGSISSMSLKTAFSLFVTGSSVSSIHNENVSSAISSKAIVAYLKPLISSLNAAFSSPSQVVWAVHCLPPLRSSSSRCWRCPSLRQRVFGLRYLHVQLVVKMEEGWWVLVRSMGLDLMIGPVQLGSRVEQCEQGDETTAQDLPHCWHRSDGRMPCLYGVGVRC